MRVIGMPGYPCYYVSVGSSWLQLSYGFVSLHQERYGAVGIVPPGRIGAILQRARIGVDVPPGLLASNRSGLLNLYRGCPG